MFECREIEVEEKRVEGLKYRTQIAVDEQRDARLEFVAGILQPYNGGAYKLTWGDRVIPFDTPFRGVKDETVPVDHEVAIFRFEPFGGGHATFKGVPGYIFQSEEERDEAILLAIEAFITLKSKIPGRKPIDGVCRVEYNNTEYRMSDFGS